VIDAPAIPDGEFVGKDFAFIVRVFQRRIHGGVKPSPNKRPNNSRGGLPSGAVDGSMPPPLTSHRLGHAPPLLELGHMSFPWFRRWLRRQLIPSAPRRLRAPDWLHQHRYRPRPRHRPRRDASPPD
jgi:hypothetical protein